MDDTKKNPAWLAVLCFEMPFDFAVERLVRTLEMSTQPTCRLGDSEAVVVLVENLKCRPHGDRPKRDAPPLLGC